MHQKCLDYINIKVCVVQLALFHKYVPSKSIPKN